ncbi:MAG: RDD family protein, partial [Bryobacteraceae bacterium]
VCLVLSYSGVLGLFTAFGGHLQAAKLDALVCLGTLALLYLQYFTLFTVMGGATPGMMLTGLRIVSFEGDAPSPSQLLWRSFGYMVSGVTAMLGFFWALWDEDQLTWQDRISQSYITRSESLVEAAVDAQGRSGPSTFGL